MTARRDGLKQGYVMQQTHTRHICQTPGCERYVVQSRLAVYCLVCEIDRDIPQPRMGRPPKQPRL